MAPIGSGAAFVAGIASFLSPCVLPLVPGYISFISGLSLEELSKEGSGRDVMLKGGLGSIFFVLGFSTVFTVLGASASEAGHILAHHMAILSKLAGIVMVIFGLHTSGLLPIRWLYYEKRVSASHLPPSYPASFLMGLAFACGWTPCIGPILGAILALAATENTVSQGIYLLSIYSLGLGIPFIATGFGVNFFLKFFARYKRHMRWGEIAAGGLLVVVGVLVFSNRLTWLISLFPRSFFRFSL